MIKLSKKSRRGLLDLGLKSLVDIDLYDYICCRATKGNNIVKIRYSDFHKDINKDCSCFSVSERNVYRIFDRLVEIGLIKIIMRGFGEALIEVIFLHEIFSQIPDTKTDLSEPKSTEPSNILEAEKKRVKQQQLIQIKQICQSHGVDYRLEKDWWEIANYGVQKVQATIKRMILQLANPRNPIYNPCGWLKTALRDNYYLDIPDSISEIALMEQAYLHSANRLIELTGSLPT